MRSLLFTACIGWALVISGPAWTKNGCHDRMNDGNLKTLDDESVKAWATDLSKQLNDFWRAAFGSYQKQYVDLVWIAPWPNDISKSPPGQANPASYQPFEDGGSNKMRYNIRELDWLFETYGSFGPVLPFAHEWAHYIQRLGRRGLPDPTLFPNAPRIGILEHRTLDRELDADRLAGAFIKWFGTPACLDVAKAVAAHYTGKPGDYHGTAMQRQACVQYGYDHSVFPFAIDQPGGNQLPVPCNTHNIGCDTRSPQQQGIETAAVVPPRTAENDERSSQAPCGRQIKSVAGIIWSSAKLPVLGDRERLGYQVADPGQENLGFAFPPTAAAGVINLSGTSRIDAQYLGGTILLTPQQTYRTRIGSFQAGIEAAPAAVDLKYCSYGIWQDAATGTQTDGGFVAGGPLAGLPQSKSYSGIAIAWMMSMRMGQGPASENGTGTTTIRDGAVTITIRLADLELTGRGSPGQPSENRRITLEGMKHTAQGPAPFVGSALAHFFGPGAEEMAAVFIARPINEVVTNPAVPLYVSGSFGGAAR